MTSIPYRIDTPHVHSCEAHLENFVYPVTALAFVQTESTLLLLAGEGPFLAIYNAESCELLHTRRLLGSQHIHGIKVCRYLRDRSGQGSIQILLWCGQSIIALDIRVQENLDGQAELSIQIIAEALTSDWILCACFDPAATDEHNASRAVAVLLTSHNVLLSLSIAGNDTILSQLASGPPSLLSSAHIVYLPDNCGLVAAGTVFGEVLIWSFPADKLHGASPDTTSSHLHYVFNGHEGSVYGVQISEYDPSLLERRFVASCSDDRKICIWDVTDLSKTLPQDGSQIKTTTLDELGEKHGLGGAFSPCVATAMGHSSRIWGLHFLSALGDSCHILSYGEDATAQVWRFRTSTGSTKSLATAPQPCLQHFLTHGFHSGKNMWAVAVCQGLRSSCRIATGGADGRVTCYQLGDLGYSSTNRCWPRQHQMEEICYQVAFKSTAKRLFKTLKGKWKLRRCLNSITASYPSGSLDGTAEFHERSSTSADYELEYLYIENGQFRTQQGAMFSASRRYVYRFREREGEISVWFVKPEDGVTVDYLFNTLDLRFPTEELLRVSADEALITATASGYHLCIDDHYQADYRFDMDVIALDAWGVRYIVQGPNKDYVSDSEYSRDDVESRELALIEVAGPGANDFFKTYTWIDEKSFIATTGNGCVLPGTINDEEPPSQVSNSISWNRIGPFHDLKGTCLTAIIEDTQMVLLTGNSGKVYLYRPNSKSIVLATELPRKVTYLQASPQGHESVFLFTSCLGSAIAYCTSLNIQSGTDDGGKRYQMNLPPGFMTTSSRFSDLDKLLILGSRNGDVAIYNVGSDEHRLPTFTRSLLINNIHAKESVISIKLLPNKTRTSNCQTVFILTTGRNSTYAVHKLIKPSTPSTTLQTVHIGTPPFGPNIEGAYLSSSTTNPELYLYGFHSRDFVLYNATTQQETLSIDCGGAHRNWAFMPFRIAEGGGGGGRFIWTKASTMNLYSQAEASHKVLRKGGHGRETKAVAVSPGGDLIATGAEDTDIRLFCYDHSSKKSLTCLHALSKHTTGIQQLRWSCDGKYLFSAAGCEEFFVWRVQRVPLVGVGVVCVADCPLVSEHGDLRVMNFEILEGEEERERFVVVGVYSDSSMRASNSFTTDVKQI